MESLKQKKQELETKKKELQDKIKIVDNEINNTINEIYALCKKNTGHKLITEREPGLYGERFTYCELCGYERM